MWTAWRQYARKRKWLPTGKDTEMTRPTENGFSTAMRMVAGKWKIDILCELGAAPRRFGRLRQSIPAISEKVLTQQLRELEADGLVDRKVYPGPPTKVVYSLTQIGAALNAGAEGLCRWGEQFPCPCGCLEGRRQDRPRFSPSSALPRPAASARRAYRIRPASTGSSPSRSAPCGPSAPSSAASRPPR